MARPLLELILFILFIYVLFRKEKTESGYQLKVDREEFVYDYLENDSKFPNAYNVFLLGANESHHFSRFVVTLEGYDKNTKTVIERTTGQIGVLLPFDVASKLHSSQPNTVIEAEEILTPEARIIWLAPDNFGCVALRAEVFHPTHGWFKNEDALTKVICEQNNEL